MSITIRRESTVALAREVAALTGESVTSAVETALAERLDRLRHENAVARRIARIREITAESARLWGTTKSSKELMDELYDDDGLPV